MKRCWQILVWHIFPLPPEAKDSQKRIQPQPPKKKLRSQEDRRGSGKVSCISIHRQTMLAVSDAIFGSWMFFGFFSFQLCCAGCNFERTMFLPRFASRGKTFKGLIAFPLLNACCGSCKPGDCCNGTNCDDHLGHVEQQTMDKASGQTMRRHGANWANISVSSVSSRSSLIVLFNLPPSVLICPLCLAYLPVWSRPMLILVDLSFQTPCDPFRTPSAYGMWTSSFNL